MAFHQLYKQREAAERIRSKYADEAEAIRNNRDLNDNARQRRLAEAHVRSRTSLDDLRQQETKNLGQRRGELERDLFGARGAARGLDAGAHAISARDASDRAAQVTSATEAAELLARAEADGDELLARAVARRSMQGADQAMTTAVAEAWNDVARTFLDNRPALMPVVEELAEIENMSERQIFSPFHLPEPHGVENAYLVQARKAEAAGESEQPVQSARPLVDPRRTVTTREQRQAWAEATGAGA